MKKSVFATVVALAVGVGASCSASAGVVGLTGMGSGTYTLSVYYPTGGLVDSSSSGPWSFDFDTGMASITATETFFGLPWTATDITFADNGDGTYSGNMLLEWGISSTPLAIVWDITTSSVTTLDGDGDGIPGNAIQAGPLIGLSPTFDGSLTGQLAPVPIPAAAWLFGSSLVGLVGLGRRRRNR